MSVTRCPYSRGKGPHGEKGCVAWSQLEVFLAMAEDALRAKSIANDLLYNEAELVRQEVQTQAAEYSEIVKAELALIDDTEILNQELQRMSEERADYRETISRLERENAFLLEERDLLSQQLASEARNATPAQRQSSTCLLTPINFLPFATPMAVPSLSAEGESTCGSQNGESFAPSTPPFQKSCKSHAGTFNSNSQMPDLPTGHRRAVLLAELRERYSRPHRNGSVATGAMAQSMSAMLPANIGSDGEMHTPTFFARRSVDAGIVPRLKSYAQTNDLPSWTPLGRIRVAATPFHTPTAVNESLTPSSWSRPGAGSALSQGEEGELLLWSNPGSPPLAATPFHSPAAVFSFASQTSGNWSGFNMQHHDQHKEQLLLNMDDLSPRKRHSMCATPPTPLMARLSAADVPCLHPEQCSHSPDSQTDVQMADRSGYEITGN